MRGGKGDLSIEKERILLISKAGEWQSWNNNPGLWTPSSDSFYSYNIGMRKATEKCERLN